VERTVAASVAASVAAAVAALVALSPLAAVAQVRELEQPTREWGFIWIYAVIAGVALAFLVLGFARSFNRRRPVD
jgi:hypothetical protein